MFKCAELIRATQGRLICGQKSAAFRGVSTDSRKIKKGEIFIAIKGDKFDGHDFIADALKNGAVCIIKGQGARCKVQGAACVIEVENTLKALGDIARMHREKFKIPVIALTGSNGKTTTKEMIACVLSGSYNVLKNSGTENNQIGLPLTLLGLNRGHDIAALEIGTNHFGEVAYLAKILRPDIAVITNIGPAHLKYFGSLKGVFREKSALLKALEPPAIAVLNADDLYLGKVAGRKTKEFFAIGFGLKKKSDFFADCIRQTKKGLFFRVNRKEQIFLNALGRHNIYNCLAAISVARVFGVRYPQIAARLADFILPKSRLNLFSLNGLCFIDDTYNSNPLSLSRALDTLADLRIKGRRIFVMGDMLELGKGEDVFHRLIGEKIAKTCDSLIAVGPLSRLAASSAGDCGLAKQSIFACESSQEAREVLFKKLSPGRQDVILVKGSRLMRMEEVFK